MQPITTGYSPAPCKRDPQVVVTDIRMPPSFQREGIEAAKEIRKRLPGTGVVILSQFDDPDYALTLLSDGAAGYAYLLKDRVGEGDQLAKAVREVAAGGSMLDSKIVDAIVNPVREDGTLTADQEDLLHQVAEGKTINAIAAQRNTTPASVNAAIENLFVTLAEGLTAGRSDSLERLRTLQKAIIERKEQGESLSRLLPGGVAAQILGGGRKPGETEELVVTVLMSDIRGYTSIAEHADPSALAGQLNEHRSAMNEAILGLDGTVMQFVGDAVMAVFGAPVPRPDHADAAVAAAIAMHDAQQAPQPALDCSRPTCVRARHRAVDGKGCCSVARVGGTPRVLPRWRHGEPYPASAGLGRAGRDCGERGHVGGADRLARRGRAGTGDGQGPGDTGGWRIASRGGRVNLTDDRRVRSVGRSPPSHWRCPSEAWRSSRSWAAPTCSSNLVHSPSVCLRWVLAS